MNKKIVYNIIIVLTLLGIVTSGYLTYLHYKPAEMKGDVCNINSFVSCSTVNKSPYAELFGFPISILGMMGFAVIGSLAFFRLSYHKELIFYLSSFAFAYMVFLTYIEFFVIKAVCIYCILTAIITLLLFIVSCYEFGQDGINFIKEIEIVE